MNNTKYSGSVPENDDDSMEWQEDKDIEKPGACVGEDGASVDPHIAHGYAFSQPGTSGYTGQKRKSTFSSPLPPKISRDIWNEKQQLEEYPSANETNVYNIHEVASGFSVAPPIPLMIQVEARGVSNQAASDNTSENVVNDDTNSSRGDISLDSIDGIGAVAGTSQAFPPLSTLDMVRKRIILLLNLDGHPPDTEDPVAATGRTLSGLESFIHNKVKLFCSTFKLPEGYLQVLRGHLRRHWIDEICGKLHLFQILTPARELSCSICRMFVSLLTPPNSPTD